MPAAKTKTKSQSASSGKTAKNAPAQKAAPTKKPVQKAAAKSSAGKTVRKAPAKATKKKSAPKAVKTAASKPGAQSKSASRAKASARTKSGLQKKSGVRVTPVKKKAAPKKAAKRSGNLAPKRVQSLLDKLEDAYPGAKCALHYNTPWELLVATILSAQCTDVRVNMVTPKLFEAFPSPRAFAEATPAAIEEYVKSTGFYRNKAKSIHGAAKRLVEVYGGKLPESMDELLTLPGAARKTANVVLGTAFGKAEGVVVDTHVLRISQRLGLTESNDPKKVEQDLMRILPRDRWIQFSHEVIHHGRQVCVARKPKCEVCTLEKLCHAKDKTWSSI